MLKALELFVRKWFNRVVGVQGEPIVVSEPLDVLQLPKDASIVVLRQDRIGDVLITIPFVRALRRAMPRATITVVLGTNNAAVAHALEPWIDGVVVYRKSLSGLRSLRRALRKVNADVVVDMMDNPSATSAMLMSATRAHYRVGIDKMNRGVYTHVVPLLDRATVHIVDRICQLSLPFGFAIDPSLRRLEYQLSQHDVRRAMEALERTPDSAPLFLVNLSGSSDERMYGVERTARVLELAAADLVRYDVRICSAPQHAPLVTELCQRTGFRAVPAVASFHAFAAIIAQASFLVTPDTSTVHLAAAFGVPSVVLYKQHDPGLCVWTPYATPHVAVVDYVALSAIEPQRVADAVHTLLRRPTPA